MSEWTFERVSIIELIKSKPREKRENRKRREEQRGDPSRYKQTRPDRPDQTRLDPSLFSFSPNNTTQHRQTNGCIRLALPCNIYSTHTHPHTYIIHTPYTCTYISSTSTPPLFLPYSLHPPHHHHHYHPPTLPQYHTTASIPGPCPTHSNGPALCHSLPRTRELSIEAKNGLR